MILARSVCVYEKGTWGLFTYMKEAGRRHNVQNSDYTEIQDKVGDLFMKVSAQTL